jgi:hypothetical protein
MLRITYVEMLPLETKQSGGKLLPHSDLWGGVFLEEVSRNSKRNFHEEKIYLLLVIHIKHD